MAEFKLIIEERAKRRIVNLLKQLPVTGVQIVVTNETLMSQKKKGRSKKRRKSQMSFVFGGKTFYGAFVEMKFAVIQWLKGKA